MRSPYLFVSSSERAFCTVSQKSMQAIRIMHMSAHLFVFNPFPPQPCLHPRLPMQKIFIHLSPFLSRILYPFPPFSFCLIFFPCVNSSSLNVYHFLIFPCFKLLNLYREHIFSYFFKLSIKYIFKVNFFLLIFLQTKILYSLLIIQQQYDIIIRKSICRNIYFWKYSLLLYTSKGRQQFLQWAIPRSKSENSSSEFRDRSVTFEGKENFTVIQFTTGEFLSCPGPSKRCVPSPPLFLALQSSPRLLCQCYVIAP